MNFHQSFVSCLLLSASVCHAQNGGARVTTSSGGTLQPWLVGLVAVMSFLIIAFVVLIVKRLFFKKEKVEENYETIVEAREQVDNSKQTSL